MKQLELLPRPEQDDDANDHVNHDLGMDRRVRMLTPIKQDLAINADFID